MQPKYHKLETRLKFNSYILKCEIFLKRPDASLKKLLTNFSNNDNFFRYFQTNRHLESSPFVVWECVLFTIMDLSLLPFCISILVPLYSASAKKKEKNKDLYDIKPKSSINLPNDNDKSVI